MKNNPNIFVCKLPGFYSRGLLFIVFVLLASCKSAEASEKQFVIQVETQENIQKVDRVIKNRLNELYGGLFTRIRSTLGDDKRISYVVNSFANIPASDLHYYLETRGQFKLYLDKNTPWITTKDIRNAEASFDKNMDKPLLRLSLTDDAAKIMAEKTAANIKKQLILSFDDKILSKAIIMEPISKYLQVGVTDSAKQTYRIALLLRTGALPEKVKLILK